MLRRYFIRAAAVLFVAGAEAKASPKTEVVTNKTIDCWAGTWRRIEQGESA